MGALMGAWITVKPQHVSLSLLLPSSFLSNLCLFSFFCPFYLCSSSEISASEMSRNETQKLPNDWLIKKIWETKVGFLMYNTS